MFRVFGIQLAMHVSFLPLLAYAGFEGWRDDRWHGMVISVLLIAAFFVCVVLHELGHSLTAQCFGVKVPRILLLPIGGMAEFDRIPRQPNAEFLITIAGPLVNFAIALVFFAAVGLPRGFPFHSDFADSYVGLAQLLLSWNIAMGCFNLLPVFPMDGGRLLRSLLATRLPYLRATWWAATVGRTLASLIVISLVTYIAYSWIGGNKAAIKPNEYLLVALFSFIFYAGGVEYRLTLLRERQEQHLGEIARQLQSIPREDVPPVSHLHGPN